MRKMILWLGAIIMCISACSKENLSERHRTGAYEDKGSGEQLPDEVVHDTSVFIVGVEVTEDYDWRRDTLGGIFKATLVLFKNFRRELELEISPENEISPEYDSHLLIDGHLFTLFYADRTMVVKRDGRTVLKTDSSEKLKGLVPTSEGIYSLCERDSGGVFTLRCNDRVILEARGDAIFGSVNDDCCGPTGALYIDEGKLYFCYRATVAGQSAYYVVEDGQVCALTPPMDCSQYSIKDIKVENGSVNYLTVTNNRICLFRNGNRDFHEVDGKEKYYDGRLLRQRLSSVAVGEYHFSHTIFGRGLLYPAEMNKDFSFSIGMFVIPGTGGAQMLINWPNKTHQTVHYKSWGGTDINDRCYCFSHKCGYCLNSKLYLALTPVEKGRKPYIWTQYDTTEVSVNGYLTAIAVKDSVTTTPGGSRLRKR